MSDLMAEIDKAIEAEDRVCQVRVDSRFLRELKQRIEELEAELSKTEETAYNKQEDMQVRIEEMEAENERLRDIAIDLYKGDDAQAWKEARKYFELKGGLPGRMNR